RRLRSAGARAPALGAEGSLTARWLTALLPFALTGDQRRAIDRIGADLAGERPMQRLLMGEVGSGKTVVALYALLRAVEHGRQGALMAPTEPLAEQHFATIQALLPGETLALGLLTGSTPARRRADLLGKLATGELALIVGTHALIEQEVRFNSLAVAVVDEQHRFGVRQRAALDAKAPADRAPHVLHMTATPIPRTLALSQYGDLDFTLLRELPAGRRPIETFVCASERERARAYDRIREELRAGRQAFVVCPLVSESEALAARAATVEYERLRGGELRDFRVVLMHGQLSASDKHAAMAAFAGGEAAVMVATSVIEVGIDVPNATVMLVEDAERYGISQLHQLRGRIGRGEHASLCLLFGPRGSARLRALAAHGDGFALAEIDLELRGEGELAGTRQSGAVQFRAAQLPRDRELQERARELAQRLDAADPELAAPEHTLLADALRAHEGISAWF
ncbi:MAG: ATP-dependent DNA helicase RecG, partial [Solirubrobacteraceae bacterium]